MIRVDRWVEMSLYAVLGGILLSPTIRDVAALVLLCALTYQRIGSSDSGRFTIPVAAFIAANVVSAATSDDPAASFDALRFHPIGLLVYFGALNLVARGGCRRLAVAVLIMITILGADCLWQFHHGSSLLRGHVPIDGRYMGSLAHPTDVSILPILFPLSFPLFADRRGALIAVGAIALITAAVSVSGTRAAWLAVLLSMAAFGWISGKASAWAVALCAAALSISLVIAATTASSAPQRLFSFASYRGDQRILQWRAAWELFRDAPVFGHGPQSFRRRSAFEGSLGREPFERMDLASSPYPHNIFLEALQSTGVVGLATFVALLLSPLRALTSVGAAGSCSRPAVASLGLLATVGLVDLSLTKDWVQACLWLAIGIAAGAVSQSGSVAPSPHGRQRQRRQ
jgi:O-antigen ligase